MQVEGTGPSEAEVNAWLDRYKQAWETRDADLVASIFTSDSVYREQPFGDPVKGREGVRRYWLNNVVEHQRDISFTHQLWAVLGTLALVHWKAHFIWLPINGVMELDCVSRLDFKRDGEAWLCRLHQEWIVVRDS